MGIVQYPIVGQITSSPLFRLLFACPLPLRDFSSGPLRVGFMTTRPAADKGCRPLVYIMETFYLLGLSGVEQTLQCDASLGCCRYTSTNEYRPVSKATNLQS